MNWLKKLKGKVKTKEPLASHTTFKIGGPARFFIEPKDIEDLKFLVLNAKAHKFDIFLIGAGSNILVSDKGVSGVVLRLASAPFKGISVKGNCLRAGAGLLLGQLLQKTADCSLSGVEFMAGIPGTIGGALAMNAGARGGSIGDLVENVRVMDYNGGIKIINKKNIKFAYRFSSLSRYIILDVCLKLNKKNKLLVKRDIAKYLKLRRDIQDISMPNAGCIFKNSLTKSALGFAERRAGRLIDLCALKGKSSGAAEVSRKHANFILNKGNAKASDVLKLMRLIKRRVKEKFKIDLKPEIKIWR